MRLSNETKCLLIYPQVIAWLGGTAVLALMRDETRALVLGLVGAVTIVLIYIIERLSRKLR